MSTVTNSPSQENDTPIMLFDGKSVSNPGVAAAAAVLLMKNGRRYTVSQFLSSATVKEAEYTGLLIGLRKAKQLGIKKLDIKGDSQLIFDRVNGLSPMAEEALQTLHQDVQKLLEKFEAISLECISEDQNRPAINAVNRCIDEALGRESKASISPANVRPYELANRAKTEDYRKLSQNNDDFTFMALDDLRLLVPESVRDVIALQWDGNEKTLAEIYRWYLRGLPPQMAVEKVQLDNPPPKPSGEKLPWEGELIVSSGLNLSLETSDPFVEAPTVIESALFISQPITEKDTLLDFPLEEPATETIPEVLSELTDDPSKDTLPSDGKVKQVLEIMAQLSVDEKTELVGEFMKSPDWINLILKAIAERMLSSRS